LPPEHAKLNETILLDFCPISQQFDHQIDDATSKTNAEYVAGLTAWRKAFLGDISIYSYYRKYAWDSLPVIIPHYIQKDLQWYAKVPVQGVSTYAEPGDWRTYELNHYVLAALAWDVNADVDAIVKKFCDARYGDVSETAIKVFATLEDVTRNYCSVPNTSLKSSDEIKSALTRIKQSSESLADKKSPAVAALDLMLQYAEKDLEIQQLRASKASTQDITAKAKALHDFVESHAKDGVFLVKDHRLSQARMNARYGLGKGN
jgi:hypothetical protein